MNLSEFEVIWKTITIFHENYICYDLSHEWIIDYFVGINE